MLQDALSQVPVVGVMRGCPPEHAVAVARAAVEAGLRCVEVTMNSPDAARQIRDLVKSLAGDALVGAGTITSPALVEEAAEAGAAYGVAPDLHLPTIERARALGLDFVPGTMTTTEILAAWREGAVMVKVFPSSVLGAGFFRALRGPVPDVPLLATGGVTAALARELLAAGADAVGVTSAVFDPDVMSRGDTEEIATRTRAFLTDAGCV
jgi:2-dehydro-3-deoxyphosphogluconate aldolase/(4S)-4-hydroxy-2-oxoglutarate aldolase